MAIPAAREPGPLVTLVRNRTVAKVDSMGLVVLRCTQMLGRILVELQQHVGVVDDLGDRLRIFGAVVYFEGLDRELGLVDVLGVVDLPYRRQRTWMCRLRQRGKNIGLPVPPATLLTSVGEHLAHRLPEPECAVTDR